MNNISLPIDNALGSMGLTYAADVLEDAADEHRGASVLHAESLQLAADFLRQAAATIQEEKTS